MNKSSLNLSLAALVLGMAFNGQVLAAGKIVFDPSNFSKNTVTAAQQVKQTAVQFAIRAEEVKQYQTMLQNLKQIDPKIINQAISRGVLPPGQYQSPNHAIDAAEGVYRSYKGAGSAMDGLLNVYRQIDEVNKELMRVSNQSKVSPERVLQYEANQAAAGKSVANGELQRLTDLNGELQYHQKRADTLSKEIPAASGALHMLQVIGSQNHLLSDQLSQVIQTTASNAQAAQNEAYLRAKEREKSANIAQQAEERNTKLYQKTDKK